MLHIGFNIPSDTGLIHGRILGIPHFQKMLLGLASAIGQRLIWSAPSFANPYV